MNTDKYVALFISEGEAHLEALGRDIITLEAQAADTSPGSEGAVHDVFRHLHSFKGMAATMGYDELTELCHVLEDTIASVRSGTRRIDRGLTELLLYAVDQIGLFVAAIRDGTKQPALETAIDRARDAQAQAPLPPPVVSKKIAPILPPTPTAPPTPAARGATPILRRSIRVRAALIDGLIDTAGELLMAESRLRESIGVDRSPAVDRAMQFLHQAIADMNERVMAVRIVPFSTLTERYPRIVRDAASETGKLAELAVEGTDLELDRAVLETLDEALIHLLRNAVDHGLEPADARGKKRALGRILLKAQRDKDVIRISVEDDGRGVDEKALRRTAAEHGLAVPDHPLTPDEMLQLMMQPGFSTRRQASSVSGRGVGLDAVKSAIETLGGTVTLETEPEKMTRFTLRLPGTLAVMRLLCLKQNRKPYGIALQQVFASEPWQRPRADAGAAESGEAPLPSNVRFREMTIPLYRLHQLLGLGEKTASEDRYLLVVACSGGLVGVLVEEVSGVRDLVVKKLGLPINRLGIYEGAALGADGRPFMIIDIGRLLVEYQRRAG